MIILSKLKNFLFVVAFLFIHFIKSQPVVSECVLLEGESEPFQLIVADEIFPVQTLRANFDIAQVFCQSEFGADIARLDSFNSMTFAVSFARSVVGVFNQFLWVGISAPVDGDAQDTSRFSYFDGNNQNRDFFSIPTIFPWSSGEPGSQSCVLLNLNRDNRWFTASCTNNFRAPICRRDCTLAPTSNPTKSPTKKPTRSPTTTAPTFSPTQFPTISPTQNPTNSPTTSPIKVPSKSPTTAPSDSPNTRLPTISPTRSPSSFPTKITDSSDEPDEIELDSGVFGFGIGVACTLLSVSLFLWFVVKILPSFQKDEKKATMEAVPVA